jgi:hypothetical protein
MGWYGADPDPTRLTRLNKLFQVLPESPKSQLDFSSFVFISSTFEHSDELRRELDRDRSLASRIYQSYHFNTPYAVLRTAVSFQDRVRDPFRYSMIAYLLTRVSILSHPSIQFMDLSVQR